MTRAALLFALSALSCSPAEVNNCTELGCDNGVRVDFVFRDRGAYTFQLDLDGQLTTCRATLPLVDPPPDPCNREGIFLGLSGSKLPADQHAIDGLRISSTTVKKLRLTVLRDGAQIAGIDRDVTYTVTPGPNGPRCEPRECRFVQLSL